MMWSLFAIAMAADLAVGPAQPYLTIDDAFDDAVDGDRILVDPGIYSEPTLDVDALTLTVQGTGPGVRIESGASRRAFTIAGGDLTLITLEVDGLDNVGLAEIRGGSLTVVDVTVLQARAPNPGQPGGSIDAADAFIQISDSTLDGAVAPVKDGGHIYAQRSAITIDNSVLRNGFADMGAGIYLDEGALVVDSVTLESNVGDQGSAIEVKNASLQVSNSLFIGNTASQDGTVRCIDAKLCAFDQVQFEANTAQSGAMLVASGVPQVSMLGSMGCRTTATSSLIEVSNGNLAMSGTVLTSTDSTTAGIVIASDATATLVNNSFVLATADGGIVSAAGPLVLTNNLVANINSTSAAVVAGYGLAGGYNWYWNNTGGDVDPGPLGTDLLGADPGIGAPLADSCLLDPLRPIYGSGLVDAGDPYILDADGSPSDIGAFGGDGNGGIDDEDLDGDSFSPPFDCDDTNANISPAAPEVGCNGIDDDCNPATLDDGDSDGDGVLLCSGDCDDNDPNVSPLATESTCNGIDDDCDPTTLDGPDGDGDGASMCIDCDDANPAISPYLAEVGCNSIDDDCDPATLDMGDGDGDGVDVCNGDCDDSDPNVSPLLQEMTCNGLDDDCDPATVDDSDDDADGVSVCNGDCDDSNALVQPGASEVTCNGLDDDCDPVTLDAADDDGDGVDVCSGDCDDSNPNVSPLLPETTCNGLDDDCDPATLDDGDEDADGVSICNGDCDDTNALVQPGASEIACNSLDDDCDPATREDFDNDGDGVSQCDDDCDDANAAVYEIVEVFLDQDLDGYGIGEATPFCLPPNNSAPVDGDCDDLDATSYPGAIETPYDGIDQDCDGVDLDDLDGDGALGADDCDDTNPNRHPKADDAPDDGIDQDCSGFDVQTALVGGAGWRCGCAQGSGPSGLLWSLLLVPGLLRRR